MLTSSEGSLNVPLSLNVYCSMFSIFYHILQLIVLMMMLNIKFIDSYHQFHFVFNRVKQRITKIKELFFSTLI